MQGVEHEHDIEPVVGTQRRGVAHLEGHVGELRAPRLGARAGDRAVVEIESVEGRTRERPRQQHQRVTGAARDIGDARRRRPAAAIRPGTSGRYPSTSQESNIERLMASITSVNSGRNSA